MQSLAKDLAAAESPALYNPNYESLMAAIYIVWAVMLWRASNDPAKHPLFIDFTIRGSLAHGIVMLIATPAQKGVVMTFIEGVPLFVIAGVLVWLRPRSTDEASGSPVSRP